MADPNGFVTDSDDEDYTWVLVDGSEDYAKRRRDDEDAPELEDRAGPSNRAKNLTDDLERQVAQGIKEAAKNGRARAVRDLLEDPNVDPTIDDNYPIRIAAQKGYLEVVQLLLADGRVDPTALDNFAIRLAAVNGHADVVQLLLADRRVDPTAVDNEAIQISAQEGHLDVVQLLLADRRVDPTADNNFAIRIAAEKGRIDVVRLLLADRRVDPTADDNNPIRFAAYNGHVDVVRLLLADSRVDPTTKDNVVIRNAAFNGYVDVVRMLLEWTGPNGERVDPTADSNSPLESAAQEGHVDVVQLLLNDSRVEPNTNDNYALKSAARNGHVDVVQLLLNDSRVDPTAENNFAIRIAAENGHLAIVRFLLDWRGANGQFVDPTVKNDTAIVSAAKEGHVDVVRVLIQWRGPNNEKIYTTRQRLREAFTLAIQNDHADVATVLAEWNGEKTTPVVFFEDTLNIAARKGFDNVLQAFLQQENYKRELWPMVYYAAVRYNRLEVLRPTLENLDSLTKNGMIEMLRGAAETGQEQLVRDLLVPNLIAKLDDIEQLYPSFSGAAASGNPQIVRMFLSVILSNGQRIDPSNDQNEALDNATERGHYEVVQLLLRQPRVADRVNQSYTIMAAANSGNLQLFDYLLNRYPNGIQRNEIRELLNRAIASDNPEILLRVLQIPTFDNLLFGIDMSSIVRTGNVEMMKVIVENNITDRAEISDTVTAFVKKNNVELLEYLISEKVLLPNRLIYNYGWLEYENTKLQVMLLDYIVKQTGIVDENGRFAKYPMFY